MELNLHPIATKCFVSGRDFQEEDRVASYLVRPSTGSGPGGEAGSGLIERRDVLESADTGSAPPAAGSELAERAFVYCRWVVGFKQRKAEEDPARTLKLTAENLFLSLAAPEAEPSAINTPLLQFLALMLERKKLIKLRGYTEDGVRQIYEHMPSHQLYEVPSGDLNVEFFQKIQEHLGVLVGTPKPKAEPVAAIAPTAQVATQG